MSLMGQLLKTKVKKEKDMTIVEFYFPDEEGRLRLHFVLFCGNTYSIKDFVSQCCIKSMAIVCGQKTVVLPKLHSEGGALKAIFLYPGNMQKLFDVFVPAEERKAEWNLFAEYIREKTNMQVMHKYVLLS